VTLKQCPFNAEKRSRGGIPNIQFGGAEMVVACDQAQFSRTEEPVSPVLATERVCRCPRKESILYQKDGPRGATTTNRCGRRLFQCRWNLSMALYD
jgi:hypothetical protein